MPAYYEGAPNSIRVSTTQGGNASAGGFIHVNSINVVTPVGGYEPTVYDVLLLGPNGFSQGYTYSPAFDTLPLEFDELPDGVYDLTVTAESSDTYTKRFTLANGLYGGAPYVCDIPSVITAQITNASGAGIADGKVKVTTVSAQPSEYGIVQGYSVPGAWQDSTEFTAVLPGLYTVAQRHKSNPSCIGYIDVTVGIAAAPRKGCKDPKATNYDASAEIEDNGLCTYAVPDSPFFSVPLLNSFRFVRPGGVQNFDNRLYCEERHPGIFKAPYYQKVERQDAYTVQWQTNYQDSVLELVNYDTGGVVSSVTGVLKISQEGLRDLFLGWLKADSPGRTRAYFNTSGLPLPFAAGDTVNLVNAGAMDGPAVIEGVYEDRGLGAPYLVLTKAYTPGTPTLEASIESTYNARPYNIYEATVTFAQTPNGNYQFFVRASDPNYSDVHAKSEPFNVDATHPDTVLIEWRNIDNAFDMVYQTGLICKTRVEARFFERAPSGKQELHIEPSGRARKISAIFSRKVKLETFLLPPWLNEKLAFIFAHDYTAVERVEYQTEEVYKASVISGYGLAGGSIELQQVDLFSKQNGTDNANIDAPNTGGFIVVNDGLLKI